MTSASRTIADDLKDDYVNGILDIEEFERRIGWLIECGTADLVVASATNDFQIFSLDTILA
jgi:hypothetical protein